MRPYAKRVCKQRLACEYAETDGGRENLARSTLLPQLSLRSSNFNRCARGDPMQVLRLSLCGSKG